MAAIPVAFLITALVLGVAEFDRRAALFTANSLGVELGDNGFSHRSVSLGRRTPNRSE